MKTTTFTLLLLHSCCQWLAGQCPSDITSQYQVDNFPVSYPNCTDVPGNLTISGNDIANLGGLSGIATVGGSLSILSNGALTSLGGLDNLTAIGGNLEIVFNDTLNSLTALSNLESIGGNLSVGILYADISAQCGYQPWGNKILSGLDGFTSLTSIGGDIMIAGNHAFTNLSGLENLSSLNGSLGIFGNNGLINLSGLEHIKTIGGDLRRGENNNLLNLTGLDSLHAVGGSLSLAFEDYWDTGFENCYRCQGNPNLITIEGLHKLSSIGGGLHVLCSDALTNLKGLENITYLPGALRIEGNSLLADLSALQNLDSIGENLWVGFNPSLTSLSGLEGLLVIDSNFVLESTSLTSLYGLENLTSIGSDLRIVGNDTLQSLCALNKGLSIGGALHIYYNWQLSSCNTESICNYLSNPPGITIIMENASGCESQEVFQAACDSGSACGEYSGTMGDSGESHSYLIFPNPATDVINLQLPYPFHEPLQVSMLDSQGRLVEQLSVRNGQAMEVSHLPSGIYLLKAIIGEQVLTTKFIKQ